MQLEIRLVMENWKSEKEHGECLYSVREVFKLDLNNIKDVDRKSACT